eukprot:10564800-Alexandrium_andersonii.AAC.1
MSASLVGSEMCIRDSSREVVAAPPREAPSPRCHLVPAAHEAGRRGVGTVSYTHLTLPTICSV